MKNKHVVFFHPYFSDGGVERTNIGLSKELVRFGYKVSFVTIKPSNYYLKEVQDAGIDFVVLQPKRVLTSQIAFARWLRSNTNNDQIVVISCQYYVNLACLLFRGLWGAKVKHVLSERNHLDEFDINQHGVRQWIVKWLVPVLYRFADKVIANSSELATDLSLLIGKEVTAIFNPTVNSRLFDFAQKQIEEEWFLKLSRPIILAVGRMTAQKDYETLIKAFALVKQSHQASLVILGDGHKRAELEILVDKLNIRSSVIMPGFVSNPYKFMKAADIFVLTSVYEGLPNVLIEALSMGMQVISTECRSGPREILDNGRYGVLVPVRDYKALANAIGNVIRNPDNAYVQKESLQAFLNKYRPVNAGNQLISLLESMEKNEKNS